MKHRKKILPWPRHYQSTSSNVPYEEIFQTDRHMLHTRKVQNWVTMSFIMGAQIASRIGILKSHFTGKQQDCHIQKFGTITRNLQRNNKNKNKFIRWVTANKDIRNLTSMGERKYISHSKQQLKTKFRSDKPSSFLIESTWSYLLIKRNASRCSMKEKWNQNNYHLTWW